MDTAKSVALAVNEQLKNLSRKEIAEQSLSSFGAIMVVPDLDAAIELSNQIAPRAP